jgi:DNA polymerase eta
VKSDEAKALNASSKESSVADVNQVRPDKRRRLEPSTGGIQKFFVKRESVDEHDDEFGAQLPGDSVLAEREDADMRVFDKAAPTSLPHDDVNEATKSQEINCVHSGLSAPHQRQITEYMCSRCNLSLESSDALQSHQDWHFAKDLHDEDRGRPTPPTKPPPTTGNKKPAQNASKKKTGHGKPEKGQSKLAFG